ncbi:MAG: isochorismatase family cysteine hydrolase [Desulfobulbus sp.]|jgi:nicotinamidase-related amidase|nr:isochorismatase family cysteine hydrolase [Desulfobulbus sp.]
MASKMALIIIDMQNDFALPGAPMCVAGAMAVLPNIKQVLAHFRKKSLPVFHVVREYRADGSDIEGTRLPGFLSKESYCVPDTKGCAIVQGLEPLPNEYRIVKNRFSAFMHTELDFMLRRLEIRDIAVCGIQYPNCIRASIFDGVSLGYNVTLIKDAAGAQTEEIAQANILDIANIGVRCVTTEEILAD